jgi:hypothetical protein
MEENFPKTTHALRKDMRDTKKQLVSSINKILELAGKQLLKLKEMQM